MYISYVLIALSYFTGTLLGNVDEDCGRGRYYDPITRNCHSCSDCGDGRNSNVYCEDQCRGEAVI